MPFNKLTDAEAERLAMLAEECSEVIQIIGKILRHGFESHHPDDDSKRTNRRLLEVEMQDVISVHIMMIGKGDLDRTPKANVYPTIQRKLRFTHHQGEI